MIKLLVQLGADDLDQFLEPEIGGEAGPPHMATATVVVANRGRWVQPRMLKDVVGDTPLGTICPELEVGDDLVVIRGLDPGGPEDRERSER